VRLSIWPAQANMSYILFKPRGLPGRFQAIIRGKEDRFRPSTTAPILYPAASIHVVWSLRPMRS
jgi:hypothetical protein